MGGKLLRGLVSKSSGRVASSATGAEVEDGGTRTRNQARIMTGAWFVCIQGFVWETCVSFSQHIPHRVGSEGRSDRGPAAIQPR